MIFLDKLSDLYYSFKEGVKSLIRWAPIIWKLRNWDYVYLLIVMKHQLIFMERNIRRNGFHVNYEQDCDNMKKAIQMLEILAQEDNLETRKADSKKCFNFIRDNYYKWWD